MASSAISPSASSLSLTSWPRWSSPLLGHDIFELLFWTILRSLNKQLSFTSQTLSLHTADVSLMALRFHELQSRTDWLLGMLTSCRTKHGSINWSLPQWRPLLSPPLHPPHPKPTDRNGATHRDDPPVHRRSATSGWRTTNIPHLDVPPDSPLAKGDKMHPPLWMRCPFLL